jgi:outer membrane cobalamin receptor
MDLLFFAAALITANLPTVVVEASRASKEPMEIAGHVETIGASEIASSGHKNLPQLLSTKSGLFVMNLGAGNPALAQVTARGYGENGFGRLQIVVDGERLNQPDMTTPNLARIPVSGIEQVEIRTILTCRTDHGVCCKCYGRNLATGNIVEIGEAKWYDNHSFRDHHLQ